METMVLLAMGVVALSMAYLGTVIDDHVTSSLWSFAGMALVLLAFAAALGG